MFEEEELFDAFGVEAPQEEPPAEVPPAEETPPPEPAPAGPDAQPPVDQTPPAAPQEQTPPPPAQGGAQVQGGAAAPEQMAMLQRRVDDAYAEAYRGRMNPYTGKPILSKADYDAYQQAYQRDMHDQALEKMRAAGIDPGVISELVSQHPVIQQAQTVIQQAQAQQRSAQEVQAKSWYTEQLREISALDPEIKSLGDLQGKHPDQYPKLMQMVGGGMTLAQAYKGLNFDALAARKAGAAQQQLRNQVTGKQHLETVGGQGKAAVEVPRDVAEQYRDLNPGMSDADIQKEYTAYLKQVGSA